MKTGYWGEFGGRFVPELLMPPLLELERAFGEIAPSRAFREEFDGLLADFVGRPSPVYRCGRLSEELGLNLYLKREDLNHTGAHKVNNTIGQGLLTKHMGKKVLLAETGAGQHGVAAATAATMLGLECVVYMGATDVERQSYNVRRMKQLGAKVAPIESGTKTLKDAINAALRTWISDQKTTHYCLGTAAGPHPFPTMVKEFQSVISREAKRQMLEKTGRLPDAVVACVGGGSNAIGAFADFIGDTEVRLVGVEAGGTGEPDCANSAPLNLGSPGVLHGTRTMLLQTDDGQIMGSNSIAPGLDYPGVGPEHAHLQAMGRAEYGLVVDAEAIEAFHRLSRAEGIIPALESSHAVAWVLKHAGELKGKNVLVCLSGRGDKDIDIVEDAARKGTAGEEASR
ncbi:MAG: tryptophan synthase subunit beta [Synergistaceae bacterium]|jgi:tryptophan synthase beta chain|nr:tryptophan synthase subunit beta [Synergistaceae bacterium]